MRKMHMVIKMVHHLQNVAPKPGKPHPSMISRMVEILGSMIKPASPTSKTLDLIQGNAKNWGYTTLLLLEDHYLTSLESLLEDLEGDLVPDWRDAFEVSKRWARRNLPRVSQDVLDHAEALITARTNKNIDQQTQHDRQAPTEGSNDRDRTTTHTRDAQQQTSTTETTDTVRAEAQLQRTVAHTVATMTEQVMVHAAPASHPPPPVQSLEQRLPRRRNACVVSQDSGLLQIEDFGHSTPHQVRQGASPSIHGSPTLDEEVGQDVGTSELLVPLPASSPSMEQSSQAVLDTLQAHVMGAVSPSQGSPNLQISTPRPRICRVTTHVRTERKMIDWGLSVRKKWLIMGDSNLARFPGYSIPDLQIDSFPGANFRHAQALMAKSTSQLTVEKLVLAFGINCRGQRAKETAIKQMQGAFRAAKKYFPYAEIWIPVINYSPGLPLVERNTLRMLNAHLIRNQPFIPALQNSAFHTESDYVHWTRGTARAMLQHWVAYLNLEAP